jgi:hypothetical protein
VWPEEASARKACQPQGALEVDDDLPTPPRAAKKNNSRPAFVDDLIDEHPRPASAATPGARQLTKFESSVCGAPEKEGKGTPYFLLGHSRLGPSARVRLLTISSISINASAFLFFDVPRAFC